MLTYFLHFFFALLVIISPLVGLGITAVFLFVAAGYAPHVSMIDRIMFGLASIITFLGSLELIRFMFLKRH